LVNLPDSTSEEDVSSLFENIKPLRKVIIENYPKARFSKRFAHLLLNEAVQPYYESTFFEKIRKAKLSGQPIVMFSVFLNQPAEVNKLFDHICHLVGASDLAGRQKAELITNELAKIAKKIKQAGIELTLEALSKVTNEGNIDLVLAETQISEAAVNRVTEAKQKSKTSKKKKKRKKQKNSIMIISIPMGGQPSSKRK
jgi:hypothetical protein